MKHKENHIQIEPLVWGCRGCEECKLGNRWFMVQIKSGHVRPIGSNMGIFRAPGRGKSNSNNAQSDGSLEEDDQQLGTSDDDGQENGDAIPAVANKPSLQSGNYIIFPIEHAKPFYRRRRYIGTFCSLISTSVACSSQDASADIIRLALIEGRIHFYIAYDLSCTPSKSCQYLHQTSTP